jgi:hypothetical protein
MIRRHRWLPALGVVTVTAVVALFSQIQPAPRFPHADHSGLFPLCQGCHEGIETGDITEYYPQPPLCVECHDGIREERVEWDGPIRPVTNLLFDHPEHEELVTDQRLDCVQCHTEVDAPRMEVQLAVPDRCFGCHAHEAREHFVDADCATCHVPLAETRFTLRRVIDLPVPATHEDPLFLAELHGELAETEPVRCATCHTRELCTSCHVDAPRVETIALIPAGSGALELPEFAARYPIPASHRDPRWEERHGAVSRQEECSTCHTRESCQGCHQEVLPAIAASLPSRDAVAAPGVTVEPRAPASHASPFFAARHGAVAATRRPSCESCHSQSNFCAACHAPVVVSQPRTGGWATARLASVVPAIAAIAVPISSPSTDTLPRIQGPPDVHIPGDAASTPPPRRAPLRSAEFHPPGFETRHSSAAYGRRLDCAQCHNPRVFCRDCHSQLGFESAGRLGPGFHDAEPVWLLRHGQAARQTLESCTTCHAQQDCMQCHSDLGAFRVNPHRSSFDARRAQSRNPAICFACHLTDPMERRSP